LERNKLEITKNTAFNLLGYLMLMVPSNKGAKRNASGALGEKAP